MIQTHAITKRFDRLQILKGIDIEVRDHEIVAIVGPSGACLLYTSDAADD